MIKRIARTLARALELIGALVVRQPRGYMALGGAIFTAAGAACYSPPAGLIVIGLFLVAAAWKRAAREGK